jgi:hypothetical protein
MWKEKIRKKDAERGKNGSSRVKTWLLNDQSLSSKTDLCHWLFCDGWTTTEKVHARW